MTGNRFKKSDSVTYTAASRTRYSAIVERAHKDSDCTIRLYFPLRDDGTEIHSFQGDRFRVPASMIGPRL